MNNKLNNYFNLSKKHVKFKEDGSYYMQGDHISRFEVLSELILSELKFENENDLTLRRYFKWELILCIRRRWKTVNWKKFKDRVQKKLNNKKLHQFIIGFGIPYNEGPKGKFPFKRFVSSELSLNIVSWETFKNDFGYKEITDHYRKAHDIKMILGAISKFRYFKAYVKGIDDRHAMDVFEREFGYLKSVINTSANWWSYSMHIGGGGKSKEVFMDPEIFLVKGANKKAIPYTSYYPRFALAPHDRLNKDIIKLGIYKVVKRILVKQAINRTSIEKILLNCINSYDTALSSYKRKDKFLNYWRVIEFATNSSDRNNSEVVSLIRPFFIKDPVKQMMSEIIVKSRNKLVHKGDFFEYSDSGSNWVKEYAEAAIQILFWLLRKGYKTTEDLNVFYSVYSNSEKNKRLRQKILKDLIK